MMPEIRKARRRDIDGRADRNERKHEQVDGRRGALGAQGGGRGMGEWEGVFGARERGVGDEVVEFGVEAGGGDVGGIGGGGGVRGVGWEEVGDGDGEFGAEVEG